MDDSVPGAGRERWSATRRPDVPRASRIEGRAGRPSARMSAMGEAREEDAAQTSRSGEPVRLRGVAAQLPFEIIVERHGAMVLRVCRAVLGWHDAQDAWSDTFLSKIGRAHV